MSISSRVLQKHKEGFKVLQEAVYKCTNSEEIYAAKEKLAAAHCRCLEELSVTNEIHTQARDCVRLLAALLRSATRITSMERFLSENRIRNVIDKICTMDDILENKKKTLSQLRPHLDTQKSLESYLYYKEANLEFNQAVSLQSQRQWTQSRSILIESRAKISVAINYSVLDPELNNLCCTLHESVKLHLKIAYSVIERSQADADLEEALFMAEHLNFDKMWMIADKYKHAETLLKGCDIEQEAHVNSRLGHIFAKIFKNEEKAHQYYRQSIHLAHSMVPRDLSLRDWYQEAAEFIKKMQQKAAQKDDQQHQTDREPFIKELEKELQALRTINTSWYRFVEYVYKTHPPRISSAWAKPSVSDGEKPIKAVCLKMFSHYHPDKQGQKKTKWYYMAEEITKLLNVYYSSVSDCE